MRWRGRGSWRWFVAAGVLAAVAVSVWGYFRRAGPEDRVYRIGWNHDPPFQVEGADGRATGVAVELVRAAARRRGVRLEWVRQKETSEVVLRGRLADLWPLITITPERAKVIHITEPYLETVECFLVRARSAYAGCQDLAESTISRHAVPVVGRLLSAHLPKAQIISRPSLKEAIEDVAAGRAAAVFVEEHSAIQALLDPASHPNEAFRLIPEPDVRPRLGVGATFEAGAAADAIRDEIGRIALEGKLPGMAPPWSYFSNRHLESLSALLEVERRARWLAAALAVFAVLLVLALWQAARIHRERNKVALAERGLRETEERFRTIVELAPDGIFIADETGRIVEVNEAACRQVGRTREELLARHLSDIVPERLREQVLTRFQALAGETRSEESCHLRADGTEVPIELNVRKMILRGRSFFVGIARDITERKRMAEALVQGEQRYRLLFNSGNDAVFVHGFTEGGMPGRFVEVNDVACRRLGYTREELLRLCPTDIDAPDTIAAVPAVMRKLTAEGRAVWEGAHMSKDGRRIPVEISNQIFDLDGVPAIFAMVRDITKRKLAEEEKAKLETQLQQSQKLESVGRLAGGIAHDFNNLLTVITGYSYMLSSRLEENDSLRVQVDEIQKAGQRAAGLTQQLLAFSRKQVIRPEPLDLNSVVADAGRMLRRLVGENVEVAIQLGPALGIVFADAGQMHQVLMNLAVNARDAMPDGGRLTIETANAELTERQVADHPGFKPGSYVVLTLSDTGTGMDEETRQHIFEPFFTTKEQGQGTGLGLSMVYGIVKQNGGWIWVYSEPGHGSVFRIYLPRTTVAAAEKTAAKPAGATPRGSETVLVVEDQKSVRQLAVEVLRQCGYRVLEAENGDAALEVCQRHREEIRLLVTDVVMPGMTGRKLAERARSACPGLKVLFMSGYSESVISHRGVIEPEVPYLQKPFSPRELAVRIRELLDAPRARAV